MPLKNFILFNQSGKIKSISNRNIHIIVYTLIIVLSIDTLLNQLAGEIDSFFFSPAGVPYFIVISSVTIICQLFLLQFARDISRDIRKKNRQINIMYHVVSIFQYFIIALVVYAMLDVIIIESYPMIASMLLSLIGFGLSTALMGIFSIIFLSWYKNNRKSKSILVLIYGLSFAATVIANLAIMAMDTHMFGEKIFTIVTPASDPSFPYLEDDPYPWKTIRHMLYEIYANGDLAAFYLKWGGTAIILYHYSHKLGRVKFWTLLSLPLIYFSLLLAYDYNLFGEVSDSLIFMAIISLNSTWGGILFYIAFRLSSKHFEKNERFRNYLLMAGFGFMLFFSGGQAGLIATVYPPWGFATMSTFAFGTYLILMGLYLSAKSVAQNEELKETIKQSTLAESKFLHSMGISAMEREKILMDTALAESQIQKEEENEEVGIAASMSEKEIKEYVIKIEAKQVAKVGAIEAKEEAIEAKEEAIEAKEEAIEAKEEAIEAKEEAKQAKEEAKQAKEEAIEAKEEAKQAKEEK